MAARCPSCGQVVGSDPGQPVSEHPVPGRVTEALPGRYRAGAVMADLAYGSNTGCVARVSTPGGAPGQCGGAEVAAVPHKYQHPWPHWTRLYVCSVHQAEHDDAEPLTVEDRRIIAERHERRRAILATADRLDLLGDSGWYEPHGDGIQVRDEVHVWRASRP